MSSQPTSAKIRVPSLAAWATQGACLPGVSEATAARARGGQSGAPPCPNTTSGGGSWPCDTIVRSPSYAIDTVTGECQPGTVREAERSMPSPCCNASQQYSP